MPKQPRNPRLSVVVTPEQRALLASLGASQGRSAASYLSDLLDHFTPSLRSLVPALARAHEAAQGLDGDAAAAAASLASGIRHPWIADDDRQLDLVRDFLVGDGFPIGDEGPAGARKGDSRPTDAAANPPLLTGGSETQVPGGADIIPFARREA